MLRALVFWPNGVAVKPLPEQGRVTVGRGQDCYICIEHRSVSRTHAALHIGAGIDVEDLDSSHGTRLSGRHILGRRREPLRAGTIVELGHATVVVQSTDAATASALEPQLVKATVSPPDAEQKTTMDRLYELVDLVAPGGLSVLLLGETGVGKEVMAERLHARSPRADKPLLKLDCASRPDSLLEGELFGSSKPGLLESAHGGTLLLDEVAELPLPTQDKLLRVLESRQVLRIGSPTPHLVDVRFVATTSQDLEAMIDAGKFRRDLYLRLNGTAISIPPLRERRGEIRDLARAFVREAAAPMGWPGVTVTSQAFARLVDYRWPGNIRELRSTIERAVTLAAGAPVDVVHLTLRERERPQRERDPRESDKHPSTIPNMRAASPLETSAPQRDPAAEERQRIVDALERCGGNQGKAAELLGISRRTLISRLDEYKLPRPRKGS
jgi:DNA-binding NtrC family response regulator